VSEQNFERLFALSGIPKKFRKPLRFYGDDKALKNVTDKFIKSLDSNLSSGAGVVFCGGNGLGKSMLLSNIAREAVLQKKKVRWIRASILFSFIGNIWSAKRIGDWGELEKIRNRWKDYLTADVLIIDDFNRSEIPKNTATIQCIEHTIKTRLDRDASTLITTNHSRVGFKLEFGENVYSWLCEKNKFYVGKGDDKRVSK
jgi:DNA replication protein DnaC